MVRRSNHANRDQRDEARAVRTEQVWPRPFCTDFTKFSSIDVNLPEVNAPPSAVRRAAS
jgi:hypothetical protein